MKYPIHAPLRPYTTKQLAALYEINTNTLRRWLQRHRHVIGPRLGHLFSIVQVEIIFNLFGWPQVKG